ncbi:UNVERIFIED_CONTAM: hypothetical protein PYX00_009296 [Menopon gallinae]|uniref:Uncharacterized protein n=1 Tax=Menopon gallinae TaxID=328185 RepID=A0AAW2HAZ3_9NEOP
MAAAIPLHYDQEQQYVSQFFVCVNIYDMYNAHPKYSFEYKVEDPHTHDMKSQWEKRDGDKVVGRYTIAEPDGTLRIVDYTADKHNGFNAVVRREGHAHHPELYKHYEGYGQEQGLGLGQQQFGGQINEIGGAEFEGAGFRGNFGYGGQIGGAYGAQESIRGQIGY